MGATPQILLGRYEVGRLLGAGGMAEVYEGHDRLLARRVAIKILLSQYAHDPAFLARFRREAQSAASLSHPNIVSVFDTGSEGDTWFIVMEYVDGRTLKDIIRAEGALYWARAGDRPPGREAGERDADDRGQGQGDGLRHRQGDRGAVDHPDLRGGRHRPVHRARAGTGPGGGRAHRRLRARLLPVRDGHRAGAVLR